MRPGIDVLDEILLSPIFFIFVNRKTATLLDHAKNFLLFAHYRCLAPSSRRIKRIDLLLVWWWNQSKEREVGHL